MIVNGNVGPVVGAEAEKRGLDCDGGGVFGLAAAGPNGNVPHSAAGGPVALAVLAKVPRLVHVVVVVVAELGRRTLASRARYSLLLLLLLHLLSARDFISFSIFMILRF